MKTLRSTLFALLAFSVAAPAFGGAAPGTRASPHETINAIVEGTYRGGKRMIIVYGRPYTKNPNTGEARTVWGGTLVPAGRPWRTGADEATLLITEAPLTFGSVTVPPGAYSLYTLLNADGTAKLIINKQIGQWGTVYNESQDFARVDLTKMPLDPPNEQFTMAIERAPNNGNGGAIKLMWDNTQYVAPFTTGTAAPAAPAAPPAASAPAAPARSNQ